MNRRGFIAGGAAACLVAGARAAAPRTMRLGFQVYGVRDLCARDLVGTLKAAKAMGYEGVETGRLYDKGGAEWKAICEEVGLTFVALQPYPFALVGENLKKTIRFCHAAGCRHISTAWYKGSAENINDWRLVVEVLNYAAPICAQEGITLAYHNHDQEFRIKHEGRPVWAWLFERFSPQVLQEFDANWCTVAGEDAAAWFAQSAARNPTIHVTLEDKRCDWPRILALARAGGTQWLIAKPTCNSACLTPLAETYRKLST